jgi:hypothetical protein
MSILRHAADSVKSVRTVRDPRPSKPRPRPGDARGELPPPQPDPWDVEADPADWPDDVDHWAYVPTDPDWEWHCADARTRDARRISPSDWLDAQAAYWLDRHDQAIDPTDAPLLIGGELHQLLAAFRTAARRPIATIAELGFYSSRYARQIRELDSVRVPGVWEFESPMALAILETAVLYLTQHYASGEVERDASRLAGAVLLALAREVERFGSTSAEDYQIDEAAARAAEVDAMMAMVEF